MSAFYSSLDGIAGNRGVSFHVRVHEDDKVKENLEFKISVSEARQLAADLIESAARAEKMSG